MYMFKVGDKVKALVGGIDTAPKIITGTVISRNGGYVYVERDGDPLNVFEFYDCELTLI